MSEIKKHSISVLSEHFHGTDPQPREVWQMIIQRVADLHVMCAISSAVAYAPYGALARIKLTLILLFNWNLYIMDTI